VEKVHDGRSVAKIEGKVAVDDVCYPVGTARAGEIIVEAGHRITKNVAETIVTAGVTKVEVVNAPKVPLIFNSLDEDTTSSHEEALLRIYQRLRPGNPPQLEKARTLFAEKFFDVNRYRLGRVGRLRNIRKLRLDVTEKEKTLRPEDLIA
jgi:DNA-directed RNA polymerase subunit beta